MLRRAVYPLANGEISGGFFFATAQARFPIPATRAMLSGRSFVRGHHVLLRSTPHLTRRRSMAVSRKMSELLKSLESLSSEDLGRLFKAVLQEGTKRKLPWTSQKKSGTILAGHSKDT